MKVIIFSVALIVSNLAMFRIGFRYGIKTEQRARLRRLNTLKKLLNGKV